MTSRAEYAAPGVRLILRDDANAANARVQAVGERKVDNTELTTKVNGRLGALDGQIFQTGTTPARKYQGNRFNGSWRANIKDRSSLI